MTDFLITYLPFAIALFALLPGDKPLVKEKIDSLALGEHAPPVLAVMEILNEARSGLQAARFGVLYSDMAYLTVLLGEKPEGAPSQHGASFLVLFVGHGLFLWLYSFLSREAKAIGHENEFEPLRAGLGLSTSRYFLLLAALATVLPAIVLAGARYLLLGHL